MVVEPYLPELSSAGPLPLSFCTSLALLRFMEALSLEKEPLRFIFPVYMPHTNHKMTNSQSEHGRIHGQYTHSAGK
jgi:hypothetical protein